MIAKPISPKAHAVMDYGLSTALIVLPSLMGLNKSAVKLYGALSANLTVYNALTDHGMSLKPLLSVKTHQKIDYLNLSLLAMLGFTKAISKQKKAVYFHAGVVGVAALNVLLTDWDAPAAKATLAHARAPFPVTP